MDYTQIHAYAILFISLSETLLFILDLIYVHSAGHWQVAPYTKCSGIHWDTVFCGEIWNIYCHWMLPFDDQTKISKVSIITSFQICCQLQNFPLLFLAALATVGSNTSSRWFIIMVKFFLLSMFLLKLLLCLFQWFTYRYLLFKPDR